MDWTNPELITLDGENRAQENMCKWKRSEEMIASAEEHSSMWNAGVAKPLPSRSALREAVSGSLETTC